MQMVKELALWPNIIRKFKLTEEQTEDLLLLAMTTASVKLTGSLDESNRILEGTELRTKLDDIIIPEFVKYAKDVYDYELEETSYVAWHRTTFDGRALDVHEHSGSNLTCVVYLEATEGDLVIIDPRGSSSRGYPWEIRNKHFGEFRSTPSSGDVIIFPSYLYHFVSQHTPSHRTMIAIDFMFKD